MMIGKSGSTSLAGGVNNSQLDYPKLSGNLRENLMVLLGTASAWTIECDLREIMCEGKYKMYGKNVNNFTRVIVKKLFI